jgi:hypothetical protein
VCGPDDEAIAVLRGRASATTELLDVWRLPEDAFASSGRSASAPSARARAHRRGDPRARRRGHATLRARRGDPRRDAAARHRGLPRALQLKPEQLADPLATSVGRAGAAHAGCCSRARSTARKAGDRILVASLADGCDAAVFEVTGGSQRAGPRTPSTAGSPRSATTSPTTPISSGAGSCRSSRRALPSRSAPPRRRCTAASTGSSASSDRAAARAERAICRRSACAAPCGAIDQTEEAPFANRDVPDRHLHARPPRLLAPAADGGCGARLRGRRAGSPASSPTWSPPRSRSVTSSR